MVDGSAEEEGEVAEVDLKLGQEVVITEQSPGRPRWMMPATKVSSDAIRGRFM